MSDPPDWTGTPTLERLCAEMIALRERNDRQHKIFEQTLSQLRDDLGGKFTQFAGDVQHAYQQLRDALTGEKRQNLALANMLLETAIDLERLGNSRPESTVNEPWAEGVAIAARKAQAALAQLGIQRYDAIFGDDYNPAMHERLGSERTEGLGPMRVARQLEAGYASASSDYVLKRAKVLVSE